MSSDKVIKKRYSLYMDSELLELMKSGYKKVSSVESFNEYCVRQIREGFYRDVRELAGTGFEGGLSDSVDRLEGVIVNGKEINVPTDIA